jgi:hypothetical protein
MAIPVQAERVNITKYIKHADGRWRFAPLARRPNGSVHWDYVVLHGEAEHHPEGNYFIEWREDGHRRRKSVGTIPSNVMAETHRQRALLDARRAGVAIAESETKPTPRQRLIPDAIQRYLRDIQMNKAPSTFRHYSHALDLFKQSLRGISGFGSCGTSWKTLSSTAAA